MSCTKWIAVSGIVYVSTVIAAKSGTTFVLCNKSQLFEKLPPRTHAHIIISFINFDTFCSDVFPCLRMSQNRKIMAAVSKRCMLSKDRRKSSICVLAAI